MGSAVVVVPVKGLVVEVVVPETELVIVAPTENGGEVEKTLFTFPISTA